MTYSSPRSAVLGLALVAALSGAVFSGVGRAQSPVVDSSNGVVDTSNGFGTTSPTTAYASHVITPLYRERTVATSYTLKQVRCASAAQGDTSVCFVAR